MARSCRSEMSAHRSLSGIKQTHISIDGNDAIDPTRTRAAQGFRSAKALFVPSVKRDIVPSVAWI
jgi:hypothetical protein